MQTATSYKPYSGTTVKHYPTVTIHTLKKELEEAIKLHQYSMVSYLKSQIKGMKAC